MTALRLRILVPLLAAALLLNSCASVVNPATGQREMSALTAADEDRLGTEEHPKILKEYHGVYDDPGLGGYVAGVGGRMVANSELAGKPFTFTVLDTPMVNAFALPGGYVYVTRGLLAILNSEAELAGVLGHETGHVTARHTANRVTRQQQAGILAAILGAVGSAYGFGGAGDLASYGANAWVMGYSRDQEYMADTLGIRYLARAGYDPYAQADVLHALELDSAMTNRMLGRAANDQGVDIFATHPNTADRVRRAVGEAGATGVPQHTRPRAQEAYLRAIDGMLYGDSAEQGFIRGRTFVHPKSRFSFTAPPSFRLINGQTAVVGLGPNGAQLQMDAAPVSAGVATADYLTGVWARGVSTTQPETLSVHGQDAVSAWTRVNTSKGVAAVNLVAIRVAREKVYRFLFVAPGGDAALADAFRQTLFSFRTLSEAEAAKWRPLHIKVVETRPGDTADSLGRRMAFDEFQTERFQALNGLNPGDELPPGRLVKLVVDR